VVLWNNRCVPIIDHKNNPLKSQWGIRWEEEFSVNRSGKHKIELGSNSCHLNSRDFPKVRATCWRNTSAIIVHEKVLMVITPLIWIPKLRCMKLKYAPGNEWDIHASLSSSSSCQIWPGKVASCQSRFASRLQIRDRSWQCFAYIIWLNSPTYRQVIQFNRVADWSHLNNFLEAKWNLQCIWSSEQNTCELV
jgi:hypothetical protein